MPLLQLLLESQPIPPGAWVVLFDDDVTFSQFGRSSFLDIAAAAGLDIAGPSLDSGQPYSHDQALVARASVARLVALVEVGPVVAFSPRALEQVLPLDVDAGMGWGCDVRWSQLPGLRRGYVDATPIRHHGAVGVGYEQEEERLRVSRELASIGYTSILQLSHTHAKWSPWERHPPWLGRSTDAAVSRTKLE